MRKTFKYRIYPTKSQRTLLNKTLEICRWVYNKALHTREHAWKSHNQNLTHYDVQNMLPLWKLDNPELKEVHSQVLQEVIIRVDLAYQSFYRRIKSNDSPPGYPRYKGKNRYDSFTYTQAGYAFKLCNNKLKLSKIGEVKIKLSRPLEGEVKTLTIRKDNLGNCYACFQCEVVPDVLPHNTKTIGIDLGIANFMVISDGYVIDNPKFFKQGEADLARANRKLSKQTKGSTEWIKAKRVVAHIHKRITNRRRDFAHKVSRELINAYGIICLEDLNIQSMIQNGHLAKSISDVAWGQTIEFINYKAEEAGRIVMMVDPRNTTKMCSKCGSIVDKTLSDRIHKCPKCGLVLDRDFNASINILRLGLQSLGKIPKSSHLRK